MVDRAVFWTDADGGKWIKGSQGKLPDKLCLDDKQLASCLTGCSYPLIDCPAEIVHAAETRLPNASTISPGRIRTAIRKNVGFQQGLKAGSQAQQWQVQMSLPRDTCKGSYTPF